MPHIAKVLSCIEEQIRMRQVEAPLDYTEVQLCFMIGHLSGKIMEERLRELDE